MAISDATQHSIRKAMDKFDREIRDTSDWADWESDGRQRYAILYEGKRYPPKKILSVATNTHVSEFGGGESSGRANRIVEQQGFEIISLREDREPDWIRDELILALDVYLQNPNTIPSQGTKEIRHLSDYLRAVGPILHRVRRISDRFRNVNGVHMKLMNFRRLDSSFGIGKGLTHGGKLEIQIWHDFGNDPAKCHRAAQDIRSAIEELKSSDLSAPLSDEEEEAEAEEGRAVTRVHLSRERNRKIVRDKKNDAMKRFGKLSCEACAFDFESIYGFRGKSFIECHHEKPIHKIKPGEKTKLRDLRLVCSNCHRMIHTRKPWETVVGLRALIKDQSQARTRKTA